MLAAIVSAVALPSAAEAAVIPSPGGSRSGDHVIRITNPLAKAGPIESSSGADPPAPGR